MRHPTSRALLQNTEPREAVAASLNDWASCEAYDSHTGRWSRLAARAFLQWLAVPAGVRWLDAGCRTGALCQEIFVLTAPLEVIGADASASFVSYAEAHVPEFRVQFEAADVQRLPFTDGRFDAVVSGLLLDDLRQPERAMAEMYRVAADGGAVAAYVWDYSAPDSMARNFWDAATTLDPAARVMDEERRFPICRPDSLAALFIETGLVQVVVESVRIETVFRDFDDYWLPFLNGQAPAPRYVMSLSEAERYELRELLRARLPISSDGSIPLSTSSLLVRGRR